GDEERMRRAFIRRLGIPPPPTAPASARALPRCAGELAGPVGFPGAAAVVGERLLPAGAACAEVEPDVAHFDRAPFVFVVAIEFAALAAETAHLRWLQFAGFAVDFVDGPFTLFGIEHVDGHPRGALRGRRAFLDGDHTPEVLRGLGGPDEFVPILASDA